MMTIEDIATELGNRILETLLSEGWEVVSQYNPFAIDKGIDFNSYTLRKNQQELAFEWDNWLEWKISGPDSIVRELAERFALK